VNPALYQALLRAARTLAAAAIAAVIVALPQAVGFFNLDASISAVAIAVIAGFLNGLGKLIRGESVDVVTDAPGNKLPF
jgi:MFS superfamily sulfate permease-like transporter